MAVARVLTPHGIHGELRCELITDFPERFRRTRQLYLGEAHTPLEVERARLDRRGLILKVAGLESREDAERWRGQTLYVPESQAVRLPAGSYFWHQIIGLRVLATDGRELGTIRDILQTGANDVYVVRGETEEWLVPAIRDVVRSIDVAGGTITVELIEGLTSSPLTTRAERPPREQP
jgi:16S rRNA processing protein RimM